MIGAQQDNREAVPAGMSSQPALRRAPTSRLPTLNLLSFARDLSRPERMQANMRLSAPCCSRPSTTSIDSRTNLSRTPYLGLPPALRLGANSSSVFRGGFRENLHALRLDASDIGSGVMSGNSVVRRGRRCLRVSAFFERFDESAVKVVKDGMEEAKRLGCDKVGTEHLLYGITRNRDGTSVALEKNKVTSAAVQGELLKMHPQAAKAGMSGMFGMQAKATNSAEMLPFAQEVDQSFQAANKAGRNSEDGKVDSRVLLVAMLEIEGSQAGKVLEALEVSPEQLEEDLTPRAQADLRELVGAGGRTKKKNEKSMLQQCSTDLTEQAKLGKLDAVVGRDEEVARIMRILVRRRKNNPALLGDPGVGKTAIVEGLAQRIVDGNVPRSLRGKRLLSLQLGLLVADTKYRGEFEERLKQVLEEVMKNKDIILFIDELHTLMGAGSAGADGGMDAAQLMKPVLARGELQCIGATTIEEYRRYVEKDAALERRFQPVKIEEPTPEQTVSILNGLKQTYEEHHEVVYTPESLEASVKYSVRYINDRFLPDKAIDLMDEAGAMVQLASFEHEGASLNVGEEHVAEVVAQWTGIPMQKLSTSDSGVLIGLEDALTGRVIGQQEATRAITKAVWRARTGLRNPARPIASLFFSGPTGVGKTELAKALAESYYGSEEAMVRIDMSEYMEAHAVSRLVGPPPGYIGFEEGGQLTEAVRRQPHSVVLLDEVEKAHPDVFNILLQVLEDGRLTDSKGRTVNFRNTLLIMTSNVGSKSILEPGQTYQQMQAKVKVELQSKYRPEFLNRLDEIIVFKALAVKESLEIAELLLRSVQKRCLDQGITLEMTPAFKQEVVKQGFSSRYGARPLRRAVQRWVEDTLAESLLDGFASAGNSIVLDAKNNKQALVIRSDGQTRTVDVDADAGMEDKSFDEGWKTSDLESEDSDLGPLVDAMTEAGLMPQTQPSA